MKKHVIFENIHRIIYDIFFNFMTCKLYLEKRICVCQQSYIYMRGYHTFKVSFTKPGLLFTIRTVKIKRKMQKQELIFNMSKNDRRNRWFE